MAVGHESQQKLFADILKPDIFNIESPNAAAKFANVVTPSQDVTVLDELDIELARLDNDGDAAQNDASYFKPGHCENAVDIDRYVLLGVRGNSLAYDAGQGVSPTGKKR